MMTGSIADWPRFFEQCYQNLNPGGYLFQFEITFPTVVDDKSWPENSALRGWGDLIVEAAENIGRSANAAESFVSQLQAAGFEDIVQTRTRWPTNQWPRDPKMKELGKLASNQKSNNANRLKQECGITKTYATMFLPSLWVFSRMDWGGRQNK